MLTGPRNVQIERLTRRLVLKGMYYTLVFVIMKQSFLNLNMHMNHLGIKFKCRFWFTFGA